MGDLHCVEQDGGLWYVYQGHDEATTKHLGAIFDGGWAYSRDLDRDPKTSPHGYDILEWWHGCEPGPKIGHAATVQAAARELAMIREAEAKGVAWRKVGKVWQGLTADRETVYTVSRVRGRWVCADNYGAVYGGTKTAGAMKRSVNLAVKLARESVLRREEELAAARAR